MQSALEFELECGHICRLPVSVKNDELFLSHFNVVDSLLDIVTSSHIDTHPDCAVDEP